MTPASLAAARRALESAKLVGSEFDGTTGHLRSCDRFGHAPDRDDGLSCTCVMGAIRGVLAFVDIAATALDEELTS